MLSTVFKISSTNSRRRSDRSGEKGKKDRNAAALCGKDAHSDRSLIHSAAGAWCGRWAAARRLRSAQHARKCDTREFHHKRQHHHQNLFYLPQSFN